MAADAWQELATLIDRGEVDRAVERVAGLGEDERRAASTRAQRRVRELVRGNDLADGASMRQLEVAEVVRVGTAGPAAAARRTWYFPWRDPDDALERLVRARPRAWQEEWAERALTDADDEQLGWAWRAVHGLVRRGAIDAPQADGYAIGAINGLRTHGGGRPHLVERLREERDWRETQLWRLFELEEASLTAWDHDDDAWSWRRALLALAADGTIARDRLLDACLSALRRDFSPYNARWYRETYDALAPTVDEHAARVDDHLALLAADDPALVGFALKVLAALEKAGRLPPDRFLDAVGPALVVPAKSHAVRAARLTGRVLRRAPQHAPIATPALVDALAHASRDVQEAATAVLERCAEALSDDDRLRLADHAVAVDPALRARVEALGGMTRAGAPPPAAGPAVPLPPRRTPSPDAPRLPAAEPLAPVPSLAELLDRLPAALERPDDPDELELLLDAISRLRAEPVEPARARTLAEVALERSWLWGDRTEVGIHTAAHPLAAAVLRWLGGRDRRRVVLGSPGPDARAALQLRLDELLDELPGGTPRPLLATPTHRGGWIDPAEAVRRVGALDGARPPVMDLAQLVLRLAPDGRREALAAARDVRGEAGGVLRRALGGHDRRPLVARLRAAWQAADHARDPAAFLPPPRGLDDRLWRGRVSTAPPGPASPAALAAAEELWFTWEDTGLERWLTRVWPANQEAVLQLLARRLASGEPGRVHGADPILAVLLDPQQPVGPNAEVAVGLALGARDPGDRALAVDTVLVLLTDRRLDGASLGALLGRLLAELPELVVPARWATSLAEVAAAGPVGAHEVQAALEQLLPRVPDGERRRVVALVDLLRTQAVAGDARIGDERARAWLAALSPRSRAGRAAREALAVDGDGAARSRAAVDEIAAAAH